MGGTRRNRDHRRRIVFKPFEDRPGGRPAAGDRAVCHWMDLVDLVGLGDGAALEGNTARRRREHHLVGSTHNRY